MVAFTESGLAPGAGVTVVASGDATATFDCVDETDHALPPSPQVVTSASAVGRFHPAPDGTLSASVTVQPPPAASVTCAYPLHARLVSVVYRNVELSDVSNRVEVLAAAVA